MQRIRLDCIDDVSRLPSPQAVGNEPIGEPADDWHQRGAPGLDHQRTAQMLVERHPKQ